MSRPPFNTPEWENMLREARELQDSYKKPQGSGPGGTRGASRRGHGRRRGRQADHIFSSSHYTPRPGISGASRGRGGFSSSGMSSTSLFAHNAPASTTQGVALNSGPQSAAGRKEFGGHTSMTPLIGGSSQNGQAYVDPSSFDTPAVHQMGTPSVLGSITNQPSPPKRSTSENVGHDSTKRARNGDAPFKSAITAEDSCSSVAPTSQKTSTANGSYSSVIHTARGQGTRGNNGGLSSSRFSSKNSQTTSVSQAAHPVAPTALPLGSSAIATAGLQPTHTRSVSGTSDVEMEEVDKTPCRIHGGLKQSRFAGLPPAKDVPNDRKNDDNRRWVPSRVQEPTPLPQHLQAEVARLNLARSQRAEPSPNASNSDGVGHGTMGSSRWANSS